jgi:predicted small lipoprotein YifL
LEDEVSGAEKPSILSHETTHKTIKAMKPTALTSLLLAAAVAISACGPKGPATIPVLDVTKTYPEKTLTLQDIATVEYIPLETREGFLIDRFEVRYMDDRIVILTNSKEDIMIFDRNTGKGLTSFNRLGRGPGEYSMIGALAVDKKRNEIFVRDGNDLPMYVYDMQGKHLRTLDFKRNPYVTYIHDWDDEHLFVYNAYNPYDEWNRQKPDAAPYRLISKADTVITDLPVRFGDGNRESMALRQNFIGGGSTNRSRGDFLAKVVDGYVVSEPGIDTIYRWNTGTGEFTPLVAQTPSFHSFEFPIGLFYEGESGSYLFMQTIERRLGSADISLQDIMNRKVSDLGGYETVHLALDKSDGAVYEIKIIDGAFADERKFSLKNNFGVPAGVTVVALQPYELLDLHEQGKLRGRLVEIAPTLKEDDNPVMMIVTFK